MNNYYINDFQYLCGVTETIVENCYVQQTYVIRVHTNITISQKYEYYL